MVELLHRDPGSGSRRASFALNAWMRVVALGDHLVLAVLDLSSARRVEMAIAFAVWGSEKRGFLRSPRVLYRMGMALAFAGWGRPRTRSLALAPGTPADTSQPITICQLICYFGFCSSHRRGRYDMDIACTPAAGG